MADFAKIAAAKSAQQDHSGDVLTSEAFKLALARGLDKVWQRKWSVLQQGMQFLVEKTIKRESNTFQTYRTIGGQVSQNRDTDELPYITTGEGFGFSVQTYNYRSAIAHERTLMEVDDVGVVGKRQGEMSDMAVRTVEHMVADIFNRGINDGAMASGAPVLSDDGCYLVDIARPNANPRAGTWTNRGAQSAITPTQIFNEQLAARAMTDENGELAPQKIKAFVCRPSESRTLWEIRNSLYRPTDAFNVSNYFKENKDATFDVVVYDYLTTPGVYGIMDDPKGEMNELAVYWRVRPEFKTWEDVDVFRQRLRMALGIGLGSPRKVWRGWLL